MATELHRTTFRITSNPQSVTIPAVAAGATLVCVTIGGAIVTAKLGVGGTAFTKRPSALNTMEAACQDITASGGETIVQISLNGLAGVDGVIYEFAAGTLGAYQTSVTSTAATLNATTRRISPGSVTTTGACVLFSVFGVVETDSSVGRRFWGLSPLGRVDSNGYQPNPDAFWGQHGISDVGAGTWPVITTKLATLTSPHAGAWAYANASGTTTVPLSTNPVIRENTLPGSYTSSWVGASISSNIAAYTGQFSYAVGDTVAFKVDSVNTAFNVEINRIGFYGHQSFGARLVASVAGSPAVQSAPTTNARGGAVCAWSTTASWAIPSDAVPGVYVANVRRTDNAAFVCQVVFVVRSTKPSTKQNSSIMLRTSDFTWQAYNMWGATADDASAGVNSQSGRSLYGQGSRLTVGGNAEKRAYSVSYDRPFGTMSNQLNTWFMDSEVSLINFLEGNGYQVDYYSCQDVDGDTSIPSRYQIAVISGHDEYYTDNLYDAYESAKASGTNLAIFSGNTTLWRVRFAGSDTNRREMICYKDSLDATGFDNTTKYDPADYTGTWRDTRSSAGGVNNTHRRPEPGLHGMYFIANAPQTIALDVPFQYKALPIWRNCSSVQALTSGQTWSSSRTDIVGDEWDYVRTADPSTPTNLVLLQHKDVALVGSAADANGAIYVGSGTFRQGACLWRASSGALIFNAGTWRWTVGLSRFRRGSSDVGNAIELNIQQATINILRDLGVAPPSLLSAVSNDSAALIDPGAAASAVDYGLSVSVAVSGKLGQRWSRHRPLSLRLRLGGFSSN